MISSKAQLKYYLECDKVALGIKRRRPYLFGDEIWRYQICMRKLSYFETKHWKWGRYLLYRYRFHKLSLKLGFSIPHRVIGPGLAIVHYGNIVISEACRIGENCRIHVGVNIGANGGKNEAPIIGNHVYIGPGAKIIGKIYVGDGAVIGANAVVTKDVPDGVTVAGVPAKVISNYDSTRHVIKATEIVKFGGKTK